MWDHLLNRQEFIRGIIKAPKNNFAAFMIC